MAVPFAFEIHHTFPEALFDDLDIREQLQRLFAETGTNFTMDMAGNEIALFTDSEVAVYVRALTGGDGSNVYYDSDFGSAVQNGP
ncbi:hypothetical protein [Mesorhizobium temperatum]|uniref:Uncharacterized protein n=1 Tax=Mesorhizobium temperatum TaxID=241416 RepID=A0A271LH78_9HYPH|nr:hypothetical protein [Mesorhizobium temperatum]PAQ07473.1 hypothetical protein CIT26_20690 [Mesorhizobium temperatum]